MSIRKSTTRKKNRIIWMVVIAFGFIMLGIALLISLLFSKSPSETFELFSVEPVEVNFQAPQIELKDLSLQEVSLKDFRNNIILVNNWATWCPPCKAEMPTLQDYYQDHKEDGFVIIAIESGEAVQEVTDFARKYSLTFPIWIDPEGIALEIFKNWDLPSSYVIDRQGIVRLTWTGAIDRKKLDEFVTPLLDE
jgi:peroxiredoxin